MSITLSGDTGLAGAATGALNGTLGATTPSTVAATTVKAATTMGVGNATPSASGASITFPATQSASTDANTLDDYEEGTWTPTLSGSTSGTASGTDNFGTYTKIGRVVHARVTFTGFTSGLGIVGEWRISLPFPVYKQTFEYYGGVVTYNRNINVAGDWLSLWGYPNGVSYINVARNYMNGTESVVLSGTIPSSMLFSAEITYFTS